MQSVPWGKNKKKEKKEKQKRLETSALVISRHLLSDFISLGIPAK